MINNIADFYVPYYITEEILEYTNLSDNGYNKCMKWANIRSLLSLAVLNNRITKQQSQYLIDTYCRENTK